MLNANKLFPELFPVFHYTKQFLVYQDNLDDPNFLALTLCDIMFEQSKTKDT